MKQREKRHYIDLINYLWAIIDNIDSLDDESKENDLAFRDNTMRLVKQRWNIDIDTDGYSLNIPEPQIPKLKCLHCGSDDIEYNQLKLRVTCWECKSIFDLQIYYTQQPTQKEVLDGKYKLIADTAADHYAYDFIKGDKALRLENLMKSMGFDLSYREDDELGDFYKLRPDGGHDLIFVMQSDDNYDNDVDLCDATGGEIFNVSHNVDGPIFQCNDRESLIDLIRQWDLYWETESRGTL